MTWISLLGSEAGLGLMGALFGGLWSMFRASEWRKRAEEKRYNKALQALEAGVELTYRTFVKSIKDSRDDGKLTEDEMRIARERARSAAIEFGQTQGIDVMRELSGEYIDVLIAKLVKNFKSA